MDTLATRDLRGRLVFVLLLSTWNTVLALSSLRDVSLVEGVDCFELVLDLLCCIGGPADLVCAEIPESPWEVELDIELRVLGAPCSDAVFICW